MTWNRLQDARAALIVPQARRLSAALLLTAYVLWPARGWGALGGPPIGAAGALALTAVWMACAFRRPLPAWPLVLGLVAVKATLAPVLVERGLAAEYFANASWTPPMERSVEFGRAGFTRVDRALEFGPESLPVHFFNDFTRFNYYQPHEPARATLPASVRWTGFVYVGEAGTLHAYARGARVRAGIAVDGLTLLALDADRDRATAAATVRPGWRRLQVTLAVPAGSSRAFTAGLVAARGDARPFGASPVLVERASPARLAADRIVRALSWLLDAAVLAWLAAAVLAITSVAQMLWAVAALDAWRAASPWAGRVWTLGGGGDPLTYESYARDILLHGPLMTMGGGAGTGEPFYYQPLYPYVLAALHGIGGDGFFLVVFAQRLMLAASVALTWAITRRLFDGRVARIGVPAAIVFVYVGAGELATRLVGEIVFIPLVCAWLLLCVRTMESPSSRTAAWAGVAGGLATLARSTLLLAWPIAIALVVRGARRAAPAGVLVAAMLTVTSAATLRNWIVAHQFVPIATSFSINLYLGNQPPTSLEVHDAAESRIYRWIGRDHTVRSVLEFARHQPGAFLRNLGRKALYTLGFFRALVPEAGVSAVLIVTWIAAAAGGWLALRRPEAGWMPAAARVLPAAVALTHFAVVVLIFPNEPGARLILPLYVCLLPYTAVACAAVVPDDLS